MILQALLVSKDDLSAETLIQVLGEFGVAVDRSKTAEVAVAQLAEARFDQVIVDFDDPEVAALVLEACRRLGGPDRNPPVTVALLHDPSQTRSILGAGAHFTLTRPIAPEQAQNTFRAAMALLKRERRQLSRVAVQAAITIRLKAGNTNQNNTNIDIVEGILLDLGTDGMDMLSARPLPSGSRIHISFALPDGGPAIDTEAAVDWSSANGQAAVRFLNLDAKARSAMDSWLAAHAHETAPEESDAVSPCKLTDLSLGGCYAQTESPFPQYSTVDLCMRAAGMEIHAEGLVRIMHPGHGMGIEFPARTAEQRKRVSNFIDFLVRQPDASPQLESSFRSLVANAADPGETANAGNDTEDALLQLLRTGNGLEQEAFLAELRRQRTAAALS